MKPFSKWTIDQVEEEFNIELQEQCDLLDDWLDLRANDTSVDVPVEIVPKFICKYYQIYAI